MGEPVVDHRERSSVRFELRARSVAAALVVVIGGLGLAWVVTRPTVSTGCAEHAIADAEGAATPAAARMKMASGSSSAVDLRHPDDISGSGDRVTAKYTEQRPDLDRVTPGRTYYRQLVTERGDDDRWRVVEDDQCERWTGT